MAKDPRYKALKVMLETGNFTTLEEMFTVVPKTVIAADLGFNYVRFQTRLKKPSGFTLDELIRLSSLIEIEPKIVIELVLADMTRSAAKKKK